jgi:hypothetical protein
MLLNKYQAMKNDRFFISIVFVAISALLCFLSWSFYTTPKLSPDYSTKLKMDMNACIDFAQQKGFDAEKGGTRVVEVSTTNFDDPKFMFAASEAVILHCQNLDMQRFCMGSGSECGLPSHGLKMIFKYEKPQEY